MNEIRELELATSRQAPDRLDEETAAMREDWLALGQAVDFANRSFDEEAAVARLRSQVEAESIVVRPATQKHVETRWPAGFLVAAALVVIAVFAIGIVQRRHIGTIATVSGNAASETTNNAATAAGPWSDELDADIDAATLRLQEVSWQPASLDASLIELDGRMVELSSDISGESL